MYVRALCVCGLFVLSVTPVVAADVYKCMTPRGVVYTDKKEANAQCTVVTAPINVVPAPSVAPREVKSGEAGDGEKKDSLKENIAEQERALAEAKKTLIEQEGMRIGGEQNYQKLLDRLKPYQEKVVEIEQAIAKLRAEQSKAK